jgi:hypothetical protein
LASERLGAWSSSATTAIAQDRRKLRVGIVEQHWTYVDQFAQLVVMGLHGHRRSGRSSGIRLSGLDVEFMRIDDYSYDLAAARGSWPSRRDSPGYSVLVGFMDSLGRKPARVAAWEERQQAQFEAGDAERAAWTKRNPEVTFEGKTIYVRSAGPGQSLVDWIDMAWGNGGQWLTRLPAYVKDVRKRRGDAWTVGIVLPGRLLGSERILCREYVANENEVQGAVDKLARQAAAGMFSGARGQTRP